MFPAPGGGTVRMARCRGRIHDDSTVPGIIRALTVHSPGPKKQCFLGLSEKKCFPGKHF